MDQEVTITFDEMPLSEPLRESLQRIGYHKPSPIQAAFIPEALKGSDILGQSQTGTGKTAAFVIPILERLDDTPQPQAIVLGPTRELVCQVEQEARRIRGEGPARIAALYGGDSMTTQIKALENGAQLVIGTPGRILDLMRRKRLKLDAIRFVVLDEADRMLDIGFRPDIERILRSVPDKRQTMLLSATMPEAVQRLSQRYMTDPVSINLSPDEISVDRIDQRYITVDEKGKLDTLLYLLVREKPRQCIIFCQMKTSVRKLAAELGRRVRGVMAMRGDMPQRLRNRVMQQYRKGEIRILVATDVVGRGIDVQGISHVINYDIPEDPEAYVHRIGRTGRMGKDGKAYTLVTPQQGRLLTGVEIYINKEIKREEVRGTVTLRQRPVESACPPAPKSEEADDSDVDSDSGEVMDMDEKNEILTNVD